ncbi:MAG: carbohydrate ABC transporter permease [Haloferacaceae archaeon]
MSVDTGRSDDEGATGGPFRRWVDDAIRNPRKVYRAMFVTAGILILGTTLFPLWWLLMVALSTPTGVSTGVGLLPSGFAPGAFLEIFQRIPFARYMFNSLLFAGATTVVVLIIASLAGYAFGRLEFRGKGALMLLILVISFFPPAAFFIPLFRLFTQQIAFLGVITLPVKLYNSPGAVIVPLSAVFMPLAIFILTTFYSQIPDGLENAARVEGTTRLGALFRVVIPLSAPGVATAGILTFISVYVEFFFSFLMTGTSAADWAPIVDGVISFQTQYQVRYDLMAAASLVAIIPVAVLVVVAQEKIVSGLTSGALKE